MSTLEPPIYVADQDALEDLAARLLSSRAVAVDCEANSFHAYHERLCLLQISANRTDFIVDPLADGVDLTPLAPVFADPAILKVFHSGEFDVMLLKRACPMEIHGMFDTRVAASSLGLPNVGLAPLLEEHFGVTTDKKFQRSDWGKRPLEEAQLEYARRDTRWLLPLASKMRKALHEAGRLHLQEVAAECRRLEMLEPDPLHAGPEDGAKIKGVGKLDPRHQRVAHELNVWRHEEASRIDRPLYKVLANERLLALASRAPRTLEDLRRTKIFNQRQLERFGERVVEAVATALAKGPIREQRKARNGAPGYDRDLYEALREWRRDVAAERNVEASLVLGRTVMEGLARLSKLPGDVDELAGTGLLERWRVGEYGEGIVEALHRVPR